MTTKKKVGLGFLVLGLILIVTPFEVSIAMGLAVGIAAVGAVSLMASLVLLIL